MLTYLSTAAPSVHQSVTPDPWSESFNLSPAVNSEFNDTFSSVSSYRQTLFFSSNRPAGFGMGDIYVSTRSKQSGAP